VANAAALSAPDTTNNIPGVIFIDGERILYWTRNTTNNTLSNIRRGISGTGATIQANNSVVTNGGLDEFVPFSEHYTWTPTANTTVQTTSTVEFTFRSNVEYMRSKLFYGAGALPIELSIESTVANVAANIITTESSISVTTEGGETGAVAVLTGTATDGTGLFNSQTVQAIFLRQP
jgi:hypothetical protein